MEKRISLGEGIYLNQLETDRFKSSILNYRIIRPLKREEVTKNALIPMVLRRGSRQLIDNLSIERRLEELYGAHLNVSVLIRGNKQILSFSLQFLDENFVEDEDYLYELIDLLNQIVFHPRLEDGSFKADFVEREKRSLERRIRSKINDKREYAIDQAIKHMCQGESFSIPNLGYIEDLDEIDSENLYDHYRKILEDSPIEIFYTGKASPKIEDYFSRESLEVDRKDILTFERETIKSGPEKTKEIVEVKDLQQAKLVMGFRTGIPYEDELYDALLVANVIFGGGSNSKLFLNVREKESLAYYVQSRLYKYKSIILVDAGVEGDKLARTKEIILEELEAMKAAKISQEEIDIAKKSIISSFNSSRDSIYSITEFEFGRILSQDERELEDRIAAIEAVSFDDILEASRRIELDTSYLLTNDKGQVEDI